MLQEYESFPQWLVDVEDMVILNVPLVDVVKVK